jgi:hypothetical protein
MHLHLNLTLLPSHVTPLHYWSRADVVEEAVVVVDCCCLHTPPSLASLLQACRPKGRWIVKFLSIPHEGPCKTLLIATPSPVWRELDTDTIRPPASCSSPPPTESRHKLQHDLRKKSYNCFPMKDEIYSGSPIHTALSYIDCQVQGQ